MVTKVSIGKNFKNWPPNGHHLGQCLQKSGLQSMETFCRHQISHLSTVFLGGISFHCPMPKNLVKNKLKYLNFYVTGEKLRDV